jgi:hypothetical protein
MKQQKVPSEYKKYFWDVDFDKLDLQNNRKFILERLLNFGTFETFHWIFNTFSSDEARNLVNERGLHSLSKNSFYFWKKIAEEKNLWQTH